VDAANCYRKFNAKEASRCLQQAVQYYMQMGRLGVAARHLKDTAEVLEKDGDKEGAMELYEKAADLYDGENSSTTESNKCKLKVAQFSAELEDYDKACDLYEEAAKAALDNNLLKYSAKGYLLNALLCALNAVEDADELRNKLDKYRDLDLAFGGSREDELVAHIADAIEQLDTDAFAEAVQEYDSMTRLDAFRTQMLLRAKKKLQQGAYGGGDDLT
jgi:alpha-soluble NSF attachment protein